jgi:hypothetical protein
MRRMRTPRKLATVGSAATLLLAAGGGAALGASASSSSGHLKPGSRKHPQGVRLSTTFGWSGLSSARMPMVTRFDLWFPVGSQYNGARFPKCTRREIARGPGYCPKGSIMGAGTGTAYASSTKTHPKMTVVNGGAHTVYFYTVLNNPARVRQPVIGHITRTHGRFVYHLSAVIPQDLRIVAGTPVKLISLHITAGRGKWLAITQAPAGVEVETGYQNGLKTSTLVWVQDS